MVFKVISQEGITAGKSKERTRKRARTESCSAWTFRGQDKGKEMVKATEKEGPSAV